MAYYTIKFQDRNGDEIHETTRLTYEEAMTRRTDLILWGRAQPNSVILVPTVDEWWFNNAD